MISINKAEGHLDWRLIWLRRDHSRRDLTNWHRDILLEHLEPIRRFNSRPMTNEMCTIITSSIYTHRYRYKHVPLIRHPHLEEGNTSI